MPLSPLDGRTALIVVDLQAGTTANPAAHPIDDVIARTGELLAAFRSRALPVVLAIDAMTDPRPENHDASVERVFPALGQTASTAEVIAQLPEVRRPGTRA